MPDRREHMILRTRLEAIQAGYEKWTRHTIKLLTITFLLQFGLGALSVYLVGQNRKRGDETRALVNEVQASRRSSLTTQCVEQNKRHDDTVKALTDAVARLKPRLTKVQLANLDQSVKANISVIDALAPRTDNCAARTARLLKGRR